MSLRRLTYLLMSLCLLAGAVIAEEVYRTHALVKVMPDSPEQLKALYRFSQLDLEEGPSPMEPYLYAYPEDFLLLEREGYRYEIEHENVEQFYADRMAGAIDLMGGYRTYAEIKAKLDSIHNEHPSITTAKFRIGGSQVLDSSLWVMKISDNPDVDEDEPEVFYNSLIHAREPAAMEAVIYFMDYLTNNYGTNPDVTYLVDNREMYFLPCVNPDGYLYNQTTNPNGGGLWRKNRRNNGDGTFGVDLNRNFGVAWGIDNDGSSPNGGNETYRGTAAFSELETQHMRDFINSRQFVTEIDYHTYSNLVIYPWGTSYYDGDGFTEDQATFEMISDSMVYLIHSVNNVWYSPGTAWQLLYNVNGGSCDWDYGDPAHSKIYAVTTEVGSSSDGFWPPPNRILPLAQENLPANLFMARIAALLAPVPYAITLQGECEGEWNGNGNGAIEPGEGFTLAVTLKNSGLQALPDLQGQLSTSDPFVTIVQAQSDWPNLNANQSGVNVTLFQVTVAANCPSPHLIPVSLHLTDPAGLDTNLAFNTTVGSYTIVDNVEGGAGGWTTGGSNNLWHISTRRAQSPTHSWFCGTDAGDYSDNMNAYLLSDTLILGAGAELSYDQWYNLELDYDYGNVEINTGGGWVAVGTPVTGSSGSWIHVTQSLGLTCTGTLAQIRFRMTSDVAVTDEGWYIDNINTGCAIPADIAVTPTSVTGIAPLGGTDTETLQICNVGACPMSWAISFNQITPALSTVVAEIPIVTQSSEMSLPSVATEFDKSAEERSGSDQLDNGGGPDAFGYRWKDSNEPDGPAFNWMELVGSGVPLVFTSDDQTLPVTLPWTFNFYGTNYATVNVSSNGNLHFGTASTSFSNQPIPTATVPNAMLAAWWDDLSPQNAGAQVLYYNDVANSRFIVQYDSVPSFSGGGRYTFEVIIYQNGRVRYQYQNMGTLRLMSATIGIENAAGNDGLQVVHNAAYIQNNLAIEFWRQIPWLAFGGPTSGSLDASQCTDVTLNFTAGSLAAGTYTGELVIESSDPDENPLTVPVSFIVGQLEPPSALTIYYFPSTNLMTFRWETTGAPQYKLYSSPSAGGPFDTLVGTTTGNSLTIAAPASARLYYVVVASE